MPGPRLYRRWAAAVPFAVTVAHMSDIGDDTPREPWSYCGEVWTDDDGRAVVVLPPLVTAHRHGFAYELTPLGSSCPGP